MECLEGRESGGLEEVVTASSAIIAIKQLARSQQKVKLVAKLSRSQQKVKLVAKLSRSQQKVKLVAKLSCSLNQVPRDRRLRRSEPVQSHNNWQIERLRTM